LSDGTHIHLDLHSLRY